MSKIPKHKPMVVAKTILIYVVTMDWKAFALLFVKMASVENHPAHGRNNIKNSKVKPLNYCLSVFRVRLRVGYRQMTNSIV